MVSCADEVETSNQVIPERVQNSEQPKLNSGSRITTAGQYSYFDWSGQVEVLTVFVETENQEHADATAVLPTDYVLIGGGAHTFSTNAGAFLTANHFTHELSNTVINAWYASSKSHIYSDPHSIRVYAIGLKIQGISAATLRSNIVYTKSTRPGPNVGTPSWNIALPTTHKLIGGGARVEKPEPYYPFPNNMLVESFPSGQTWNMKSKDHYYAESRAVSAYAIGIKESITGFGLLDILVTTAQASVTSGIQTLNVALPLNDGLAWVNVGVGAKDSYTVGGYGRLLMAMAPKGQPSDAFPNVPYVKSKDHRIVCGGTLYAYGIFIRKKP